MGEIENSLSLELRRHLNSVDEHFDLFVKKKYDFSGLIKMACNLDDVRPSLAKGNIFLQHLIWMQSL